MESSQILGVTEEYGSSESGWTMYIGSPVHGNDSCDADDDHSTDKQGHDHDNDDDYPDNDHNKYESDDSMASDASSGPRHQEFLCESSERSLNINYFKHEASKRTSEKKLCRQVKKRDDRRMKEKQESLHKENVDASHVQGGSNVRKTN
ncbi:hypothetical protein CFOL_v3_23672 [Cephalotus follicularis]|uniref:Uncharacterized protein n=1 Tax=Cephalotus follicularis TaxID=3775 RepID=A0A1Q3CJG5_CEPFO|nr:hypothetical protein CFOL_v3_23672 [Cephalotus follicularis]